MKRATAILLTVIMCASLCACGGNEYEKYEDIFEYLEEGDYDAAIEEIEEMREDDEDYQEEEEKSKGDSDSKLNIFGGQQDTDEAQDSSAADDAAAGEAIEDTQAAEESLPEFTAEEQNTYWEYSSIVWDLSYYDPAEPDSFSIWDDTAERNLEGSEALQFCYEMLLGMGSVDKWIGTEYDYESLPPRQQLIDSFATVDNVLLYTHSTRIDNMGNESNYSGSSWYYDESGRLIYEDEGSWEKYEQEYGISGWFVYEYDKNGRVSLITVYSYSGSDSVEGIITPVYDENGVHTSDIVKTNEGEIEHLYAYDAEGRLISKRYGTSSSDGYVFTYTYDENGRLTGKLCENVMDYDTDDEWTWDSWETKYIYDENGTLTEMTFTDSHYWTDDKLSWYTTDTIQCFHDDQGRLVKTVTTPGSTIDDDGEVMNTPNYASYTTEYVYGTYYIYTPAE